MTEKKGNDNFQMPTTQAALEKIDNTVYTFLKGYSVGFKILIIKAESEKVTNLVGTFLNEDNNGFHVPATKMEYKRLPIWWEPFE